jgi:hypothetical protein
LLGLRRLVGFGLIVASAKESTSSRLVLASQLDNNVGGGERDVERHCGLETSGSLYAPRSGG